MKTNQRKNDKPKELGFKGLALILLAFSCLLVYFLSQDSLYVSTNAQITHAVVDWDDRGRNAGTRRLVYYYAFPDTAGEEIYGSDAVLLTKHASKQYTQNEFNTWLKKHPIGSQISIQHLKGMPQWNHGQRDKAHRISDLLFKALILWLVSCVVGALVFGANRGIRTVWKR